MEKKRIILPTLRYENSPELDMGLLVNMDEEKSILRTDDRDIILDLSTQFETERSGCKNYKFYGKMKMVFRNLYQGESDYSFLKQRLALKGDGSDNDFSGYLPYNEFAFLRNDVHHEVTNFVSVNSMNEFSGFTPVVSGTTEHQNITEVISPYHNWNLYLTYVYNQNSNFPMKYTLSGNTTPLSFVSGDGIPFRIESTDTRYVLTSPVEHGISEGEYVILNSVPYYVNSVGNEIYNSEKFVINLSKTQMSNTSSFNYLTLINGKRCTDITDIANSTSEYYIHEHKTLTLPTDFNFDKIGFESPIWEDEKKILYENSIGENDVIVERNRMESILFDLKSPFILTGITNNLGCTPTDMYVSVIFKNGNGFFDYPPKVGYSFHMHDSWMDYHFNGTTSLETGITYSNFTKISDSLTYTFTSGNTMDIGTILHGAFVEYNPKEMKERIISESIHKISSKMGGTTTRIFDHGQTLDTTYSGATVNNPVGLYYQPHYRFKLRELSPYVEESNTNNIDNLPENAKYFSNEKLWRWRDLYDNGYIDADGYGVDYPYLNNIHYVHKDINFYLRNEKSFKNKKDGLINFYNNGKIDRC